MAGFAFYSDNGPLQQIIASAFSPEFSIFREPTEESLMARLASGDCDVVLLDLDSEHRHFEKRLAFARRLAGSQYTLILLADDSVRPIAADLVRAGAYDCCRKPISLRDLGTVVRRATSQALPSPDREDSAREPVETECDQLVGSSGQMLEVYDMVRRLAPVNASVLITGESGTGKELIAQALHKMGARASEPFVAVSCGAIPETLMEAELFGHEKGAFTGTVGARVGYFEQAAGGTLFLDEIGELSPATQVKLLRVLQQREFTRLGSSRPIPLRARLVFATHADLSRLVEQGTFRLDLYYRINVVRICVPPLAERPEDIPALVSHFLDRYSSSFGKPVSDVDPKAMAVLQSYSWPGNVRELENVVQRAIIMAADAVIRIGDLPTHIQGEVVTLETANSMGSFEAKLREFKIQLAESAIRENGGNKTLAARSLNISRAYLHRLIRPSDNDLISDMHSNAAL